MRGDHRPERRERITHCGDAGFLRRTQQRAEYLWKDVSVLVRIEMRELDVCGLDLAHLRQRLGIDFFRLELPAKRSTRELRDARDEAWGVGIHKQGANVVGRFERCAIQ